jgi:hypothetical protein
MLTVRFLTEVGRSPLYVAGAEVVLDDAEALGWVGMGFAELADDEDASASEHSDDASQPTRRGRRPKSAT